MKILVTGGAGFIGSHICKELIAQNHEVVCIDNLSSGFESNITSIKSDKFTFIKMDVNTVTPELLLKWNVNAICHQAAIGSVPKSILYPELYQYNNVNGFFTILNSAKAAGIKRIVYASSSSVYGSDTTLPKVESKTGVPLSPYAGTKQINELQAKTYHTVYDMETIGLRYFNVFGPNQNPDGDYAAVIPKFIKLMMNGDAPTINGDGSFSRDFTYIDNVVSANIAALTTENVLCFGQAFNIGAGGSTSILELFTLIKTKLNYNGTPIFGPFRKGDIANSVASIEKAKEELAYNPLINVESGLTNTIIYFYENFNNSAISK
jgi:UDP-N-acetylglucosamine/UDP-N-acetylgalactosamine 4-epimerase